MGEFDSHPGTSKLASVLCKRMKKENESPLKLDIGEIQANGSLVTNTFPVPIPKGDYSVCSKFAKDKSGTRTWVLVAWVQNEAVVVDAIEKS